MNDNTIESIEWHKEQLAKLLSDEDNFGKVEAELDFILEKGMRGQRTELRTVRRGGKVFQRKTRVGRTEREIKQDQRDKLTEDRNAEKNDYGISWLDISEGDTIDAGDYGGICEVTEKIPAQHLQAVDKDGNSMFISIHNVERFTDDPEIWREEDEEER